MRKQVDFRCRFIMAALLAIVLVTIPVVGFAVDSSVDCLNKPEFDKEPQPGYYIWRDKDDVWHVVTVTNEILTEFSGDITVTKGKIVELNLPDEKKMGNDDVVIDANRVLEFSYLTDEEQLEFEFEVTGSTQCLTFDLKIDKKRKRQSIFLGERKVNPRRLPFYRCY